MAEYVTREDIVGGGAFQTELTDDFDDGAPGDIAVSDGQRIAEMTVAVVFEDAAEDDMGVLAIRFGGSAVTGSPTIPVAAGGIGAAGTGAALTVALNAFMKDIDIPLAKGKIRIYAVGNFTTNHRAYVAAGITIV